MAGYDFSTDHHYGLITTTKGRTQFLAFVRYLRTRHPPEVRIAIVLDNFSPHTSTKSDQRVALWAAGQQRRARLHTDRFVVAQPDRGPVPDIHYFAPDGTDHASHKEQASMIRRYIIWRNRNAPEPYGIWSSAQTLPDAALG